MLPTTQIQEQLSRVFVGAIAANIGCDVTKPDTDYDSVDVIIRKRIPDGIKLKKSVIEAQLKATTQPTIKGGSFTYALPVKNYNDLREEGASPRILVVLLMPQQQCEWVSHTNSCLSVRDCAYWTSLAGSPATTNSTSITITMDTKRVFNGASLDQLLTDFANGKGIAL